MKKILTFVLILILALLPVSAFAAEEDSFTDEKDGLYLDENGEVDHGFPDTVEKDGKIYVLSEVKLESNLDAEPEIRIEKLGEAKEKESSEPEKIIEIDGVSYQLKEGSVRKIERVEERSITKTETQERDVTSGEEGAAEIEITFTDEETGEEIKAKIPFKETEPLRTEWVGDFTTEMSFYNYDADVFLFGDTVIERNDQVPLTPDQYAVVMAYLGMNPADQRITNAAWGGDAFQDGDSMTRIAVLSGETLHQINTDTYEGEVELPSITWVSYEAEYEEFGTSLEQRSSVKATATYVFSRMADSQDGDDGDGSGNGTDPNAGAPQRGFFQTPAGQIVLIGIVVLVILIAVILYIFMKKPKKDDKSEKS